VGTWPLDTDGAVLLLLFFEPGAAKELLIEHLGSTGRTGRTSSGGCAVLATRSLCTTTAASSPRGQPEWHDAVEVRPRPRRSQQWQVVAAVHVQELLLDPRGLMDIVCIMLFVGASHSCYPTIKQQMQDRAQ
jgi:hypothetical protein